MLKNRNTDAQSLVILILMCFVYMLTNVLFNWNSADFTEFLIFLIAWRLMTIEGTLFK